MSVGRKIFIVTSVLVLFFSLMAWAAEATRSQPLTAEPQWEQGFLDLYSQVHGDTDAETQSFLVEEATLSCARLSNGYSLPEVWEVGVRDGMSSDQSATVINTAVLTTCPEMQAKLKPELAAQREQGNTTWYPMEGS